LKSLWHGGFETSTAQITPALFDSAEMTRCARSVIEEAANQGDCVIVGRGGQCLLSHREDVLHAFVWAPRAWRVRRIAQRLPDERNPEQLMDRVDRTRIAFLRQSFDANWCDHRLYDVVINSALGEQAAADCIVAAMGGESRANG
jgi:cytidylate kinase